MRDGSFYISIFPVKNICIRSVTMTTSITLPYIYHLLIAISTCEAYLRDISIEILTWKSWMKCFLGTTHVVLSIIVCSGLHSMVSPTGKINPFWTSNSNMYTCNHDSLAIVSKSETFFLKFSSNSEAFASELLENFKEMY